MTAPEGDRGLDIRILGPLEVWRDGRQVTIPGRKARTLLACLVAAAGNTVSRDRLIEAIWGDSPPASAVNTLHTYVTHLRSALDDGADPSAICTHPTGYRLDIAEDQVDAWRLERRLDTARRLTDRREFTQAVDTLDDAVADWRGPALEEFVDFEFAQAEAGRLEDLRYHTEELLVTCLLECGQENRAIELGEQLVEEFPFRERLWQHLMVALYRDGRQADALAAFRRLGDVLSELGLEPGDELIDLESRILEKDPSLHRRDLAAVVRPTPRPIPRAPTSFVGRRRELEELASLMVESRLVTLTGVGGVGKSRLALEHGHAMTARLGIPGRYVDLATTNTPESLIGRLAEAMGIGEVPGQLPLDLIAAHLDQAPLFLVLDNAEELVVPLGRALPDLLGRCSGLQVTVASREPLGVPAEAVFAVGPLDTSTAPRKSDATELFIRRAQLTDPLGGNDLEMVTGICRALDGMPAAIEVVAAASKMLSLAEIGEHLEDVLSGDEERHSIPVVLTWTYRALSPDQQRLFLVASMFPGGFTFDALAEVAGALVDRRRVLQGLAALIDRSLVFLEGGTPSRYRVLDVFRRHALSWLEDDPIAGATYDRFFGYFETMVGDLERSIGTGHWRQALERVDADEANCAHAIDVAVARGATAAAYRIAGPLARYWRWRGRSTEGAGRLMALIQHADAGAKERAKVERELSATMRVLGRFDAARAHGEAALAMSEGLGGRRVEADALYDLGMSMIFAGEFDEAETMLRRAAGVWEVLEERTLIAFPLIPLAWLEMIRGEYDRAETLWASILTDVDLARFPEHSGITFRVAELALAQGQLDRARRVAVEALEAARTARYPYHEAGARVILANVHLESGELESAGDEAERAMAAATESGNAEGASQAMLVVTRLAILRGDGPGALGQMRILTRFARQAGGSLAWVVLAELVAALQVSRGEHRDAAVLYGATATIRSATRLPMGWLDRQRRDRDLESVRVALGETGFDEAYDLGRTWTEEAVVEYVSSVSM